MVSSRILGSVGVNEAIRRLEETSMKLSYMAGAFASLLVAGAAHAQSPVRGNNVDDFGPFTYSNPSSNSASSKPVGHVSPVASNNVDDFGPMVSARPVAQDELGAAGGEPGMDVVAAERAKEKAAIAEYNRQQWIRSVWTTH